MATSKSLTEFKTHMLLRAVELGEGVKTVVRKAAVAADQAAVMGTPVDTGRARANWITSIGSPASGEVAPDPSGASALQQNLTEVAKYALRDGIFMTNNVPYIGRLEEGYSKQAPNGMLKQAISAAISAVRALGGTILRKV
jgi:hypothetical protein